MAPMEAKKPQNPLATLVVAWMVVVGLAFAPVGTFFYTTGDIRIMIAFLGSSFLIGASLLIAMGLGRMGSRERATGERGEIADLHARGAIFGRR